MKKVLTAIVTFIFSVCLITATVATASAASVKKVTNFKASATPIAVTLTWNKASGAKGYEIQQKSGKKWKAVATIKKQKTTTYTVKKLKNGTTYQFRIRAVNGKKKSAYVTVKVKTGVQKIANVKATSAGLKSAKLTWDKANVTGYEIQRKDGKKWKTVKKIKKAKTTSLTVSKLPAAKKATFRIRGYVNGSAKTYYGSYTTVSVTTAVAPMKNVSVKSVTDTSATIGWAKLSGASGYQVQKLQSGKWVDLNKAVKNSVTQYTVKGIPAFTNQQLRVRAYQKDGKKTYYNNWVTVNAKTKMGNVTGVTYSGLSANAVKISWKAAGGAAGYRVMNGSTKLADVKTNYAEIKTLKPATAYKITVVPYNGATAGNATSAITFTTPCAQVTGVKVSNVTRDAATVSWNKTAGATGYQLQYKKDGVWSSVINVTGTSYSFKDLSSYEPYAFRVRALNKNGSATQYGVYSAEAKATTKGLGSFANGTINWSSVAGAKNYTVEYYNSENFRWEVAPKGDAVEGTSYNASDIYTETTLFRVTAYGEDNKFIETSNTASANISNVQFSFNKDTGIVTTSWSKYEGASSYEVRIKSKGMTDGGATVYTATDVKRSATSKRLTNGFVYEVAIVAVKGNNKITLASFDVKTKDFNYADNTNAGKNEQLLYLVEAINRTKFDDSYYVNVSSKPNTVNRTTYIDMGLKNADNFIKRSAAHAFLKFMFGDPKTIGGNCVLEDGFMKFQDATAIDSAFATKTPDGEIVEKMSEQIVNPKYAYSYPCTNGKYGAYNLDELVQPVDGLAYLYNNKYDPNRISVTTTADGDGYHYEVVIKKSKTSEYHDGFLTGASLDDLADVGLGGLGNSDVDSNYYETTVIADVDANGKLTKYSIDSAYDHKINIAISLTGANLADDSEESKLLSAIMEAFDDVVIEMNTHVEGTQKYEYTFQSRRQYK